MSERERENREESAKTASRCSWTVLYMPLSSLSSLSLSSRSLTGVELSENFHEGWFGRITINGNLINDGVLFFDINGTDAGYVMVFTTVKVAVTV